MKFFKCCLSATGSGTGMAEFGEQLRKFRHQCNDPKSPHGKLTQEKFGELVGVELGISYSGAAISDWERGKAKIHADNRLVLMAIVKVLYECGGLKTVEDANQLLEAGNYRALDPEEIQEIFKDATGNADPEQSIPETKSFKSPIPVFLASLFAIPEAEVEGLMAKAQEGPTPIWPRVIVFLVRRFSDQFSVFHVLKFFLWVWVWLLTWLLILPSLHWPFLSRESAFLVIVVYAAGSILIPALIGTLTNTKDNKFWKDQQFVSALNLRLYSHQGASIGLHIGYFFIFMTSLLRYNLGLRSVIWVDFIAAAFLLLLGYTGARLIPHNLFSAYKRLWLKDGYIFFVFFLIGPAWGYFFYEIYDVLLTIALGIFIVLVSITILLAMMALRYRQSGTTVIPVHWWIVFFGSIMLCQFLALFIR